MILSSLCYDMLNCQLIPQFPFRYGVNHYIMIVATGNISTTTNDMLPMLQDMLPLPQLCPECQMLARVPASASVTSATSDHPRSPPTSGQPRPWRQPSSNGRRGRQLASPTSQSQASSDQSRMARIIWALLQFALIFRSPALLILFSLLSDIFKAIPLNDRMKDCLMFNLGYLCDSYSTVNHTKVEMETIPINITPNVQQSVPKMSVLC